ncbi:unnamed protein product [Microthlaspi erraticum]|uniref:Uncharacterized protein n=1 Tax=Microthlaspi erraticum TaxID=1685480 RepID=A0A6D2JJJ1_9BRAS|nr:unnamed protein product [Microthlaspi erraticum]
MAWSGRGSADRGTLLAGSCCSVGRMVLNFGRVLKRCVSLLDCHLVLGGAVVGSICRKSTDNNSPCFHF